MNGFTEDDEGNHECHDLRHEPMPVICFLVLYYNRDILFKLFLRIITYKIKFYK